jgi:hypothetical protein
LNAVDKWTPESTESPAPSKSNMTQYLRSPGQRKLRSKSLVMEVPPSTIYKSSPPSHTDEKRKKSKRTSIRRTKRTQSWSSNSVDNAVKLAQEVDTSEKRSKVSFPGPRRSESLPCGRVKKTVIEKARAPRDNLASVNKKKTRSNSDITFGNRFSQRRKAKKNDLLSRSVHTQRSSNLEREKFEKKDSSQQWSVSAPSDNPDPSSPSTNRADIINKISEAEDFDCAQAVKKMFGSNEVMTVASTDTSMSRSTGNPVSVTEKSNDTSVYEVASSDESDVSGKLDPHPTGPKTLKTNAFRQQHSKVAVNEQAPRSPSSVVEAEFASSTQNLACVGSHNDGDENCVSRASVHDSTEPLRHDFVESNGFTATPRISNRAAPDWSGLTNLEVPLEYDEHDQTTAGTLVLQGLSSKGVNKGMDSFLTTTEELNDTKYSKMPPQITKEHIRSVIAHFTQCEKAGEAFSFEMMCRILGSEALHSADRPFVNEKGDCHSILTEGSEDESLVSWFSLCAEFDDCASSLTFQVDGNDVRAGRRKKQTRRTAKPDFSLRYEKKTSGDPPLAPPIESAISFRRDLKVCEDHALCSKSHSSISMSADDSLTPLPVGETSNAHKTKWCTKSRALTLDKFREFHSTSARTLGDSNHALVWSGHRSRIESDLFVDGDADLEDNAKADDWD